MQKCKTRRNSEKPEELIPAVSIQILQYEFLGPVPLSEWGPPMGELLYIVLSKDRDKFNMLYAGDCEHTDDGAFFVQHRQFGCWVQKAGSESALHLAVFPMKGSDASRRQTALRRILSTYRPPCNPADAGEKKPSYNVRKAGHGADTADGAQGRTDRPDDGNPRVQKDPDAGGASNAAAGPAVSCPCCGIVMSYERDVGARSALYRCGGCGMSDTRIV